jgi:hypothetical protein
MILSVLEDELNESTSSFLTIPNIAEAIYGYGYGKRTAFIYNKQIRERMGKVRLLAEQNGMIVIPLRKAIKNDPSKKFRIVGWKIADESDQKYIFDELLFIKRKGEEHSNTFLKLKTEAKQQGILTYEKIRELRELN